MKRLLYISLLVIMLFSLPVGASKPPKDLISDSVLVLREIAEQPDSTQLQRLLKNAHGVAIFPSVIKAGLGLGGRYGEGVILKYDPENKTWYGPYFVNMKGLSYGFQVGIQSTALVIVVNTERGMESLKEGKVTLGGSLSIAAGPLGRSAEAGTDISLKAAMYSYSLSKGAFIGASFEGAVIDNSINTNQVYWQEELSPAEAIARKASGEIISTLLKELNSIVDEE